MGHGDSGRDHLEADSRDRLAGTGFTMSLFISGLAFIEEANLEMAKVGILLASLAAGLIDYFILRFSLWKEESGGD